MLVCVCACDCSCCSPVGSIWIIKNNNNNNKNCKTNVTALCVCVCVTVCLDICNKRSLHQMASTECSANVRFSSFRLHYQSGGGFVGWDGSTRSKQQQRGMLGCVPAEVLFNSRSRSKNSKFCRHNLETFWVSRSWFSGPARSSCGTDGRHAAHPYRRNCIADN